MNKDKLRQMLQERTEAFQNVDGREVVRYAPEPPPEKRAWSRKKNLLDEAFENSLAEEEKRQQKEAENDKSKAPPVSADLSPLHDTDAIDMSPS